MGFFKKVFGLATDELKKALKKVDIINTFYDKQWHKSMCF